jgi:hypothetical protein
VFLITLGPQLYDFIINLILVFFLIVFIDNLMFLFLNLVPVSSEGNIVDHISANTSQYGVILQYVILSNDVRISPCLLN